METIQYGPTDGLSYNPNEPLFWDKNALQKELTRAFELCHGCRLCFKFCPAFPTLFNAVDAAEGNVRALKPETTERVVDECFQCQLCYVNCPYTPSEGHEFQLDFPKLLLRAKAIRVKEQGIPLRDRILSHPVRLGELARPTAPLANFATSFLPLRALMEKTLGIHRDKKLPPFYGETFVQWFRQHAPQGSGENGEVVLFTSCFVNYNGPEIGKAVVEVLAHNGLTMRLGGASCCGMPALDTGDITAAQTEARRNVEALFPLVNQGLPLVVVNPTCSMMLKREYPNLLDIPHDDTIRQKAELISRNTFDVAEFVLRLHREGKFRQDFRSTPGTIAYHVPCHLKTQNIGFPSRDLMRLIPGTRILLVNECSGHDGTWAMKVEHYQQSVVTGKRAFEGMKDAHADVWTSDCPLAALHIEQHAGTKTLHPFQVLARAYREDGFPHTLSPR